MYEVVKRTVDIVGASMLLILLSPVMILTAVVIVMESGFPVLFCQERVGKQGKRFRIYKFRSMRKDAEQLLLSNPSLHDAYVQNGFKLPDGEDPRITPFGRVIRTTSLDELPQLFNVLAGSMSLVGPRPIVQSEMREYGNQIALFLSAKPGVTGYWQVSGRADVQYPERVSIELHYVKHRSLCLDIIILLKTPIAVIARKGAF